jgi:trigger factor
VDINLNQTEGLDAELHVRIDPADYEESFEKEVKNYRQQASLPGFRKGKVPTSLIRKKIGTELKQKLVPDTVNKAIQDYIKEQDLKLLLNPLQTYPESDPDWENQDTFEFKYQVGLRPSIDDDLQASLGELTQYRIKAADEEIDEQVRKIKNLKGTSETKEAVEDSENLALRFKVEELDENGEVLEEGFSQTKAVNLKDLPEQLQQELIGAKPDDAFTLDLRSYFEDEDRFAEFLDTLGSSIRTTVQSVYEFEEATLDETIFQEIFPDKTINDEEEFKAAIREALESNYERESDGHLFKEIKDAFVKHYDKGLPDGFLKQWFSQVQSEQEEEEESEKTEDEKYEDFVNDIKWMAIVDGLAERFDITVENQEVMEYAQAMIRNEVSRIGMGDIGEDKVREYAAFQVQEVTYNEFQQLMNPEQEGETEKAENNEQSE